MIGSFRSTGGDEHETLTTRLLNLSGARLHIYADISKNGEITVAMLDRDGEPIAGLDNSDCKPVKGNHINMPVSWQGNTDLTEHTESSVRFRFHLRHAKLFSFWIEEGKVKKRNKRGKIRGTPDWPVARPSQWGET